MNEDLSFFREERKSLFKPERYRKPLWLKVLIPMLFLCGSLAITQGVLRDPQIMAQIKGLGQIIYDFTETEMAYRAQQKQAEQAAHKTQSEAERPVTSFVNRTQGTPDVQVTRFGAGANGGNLKGYKRIRVELAPSSQNH